NTQTSARPMPSVVSCGLPAPVTALMLLCVRCWPRWAVLMNAQPPGQVALFPANTMSRGSSPTSSVRDTRGGVLARSTMLTLSERWLTTHTSLLLRAATATGSMPTGIDTLGAMPAGVTSKISRWLSGVFTAKSFVPSGESASGRTGPLSKAMKLGCCARPEAGAGARASHQARELETRGCIDPSEHGSPGGSRGRADQNCLRASGPPDAAPNFAAHGAGIP